MRSRRVVSQQELQVSFSPPLRTPLALQRRRGLLPAPCLLRGRSTGLGADCCSPATPVDTQHRVKDEGAWQQRMLTHSCWWGPPKRLELHPRCSVHWYAQITYACVCAFWQQHNKPWRSCPAERSDREEIAPWRCRSNCSYGSRHRLFNLLAGALGLWWSFNKWQITAAKSGDVRLALHPYPVIQESGCHLIPIFLQLPLRSLRGLCADYFLKVLGDIHACGATGLLTSSQRSAKLRK